MGMSLGGGSESKSEINVTPLVDVCLVLLIIFMVMVPRKVPEISVRLPPERTQTPRERTVSEQPLIITMAADGGLQLNRRPVDRAQLRSEIARQLEFRDKKAVFVDVDDKTAYGQAVKLMGLAKQAGAEVVALYKKKDEAVASSLAGL